MVFSPCSFEEGYAGFECVCSIFVYPVNAFRPRNRQSVNGFVQVFHDFLHHEAPAVACAVERSLVIGGNHMVIPRDVAIFADFFIIEHCPEEIGDAVVFLADVLARAVHRMFEIVVQFPQIGPCA